MKKFYALTLAMLLVFSMAAVAMAADYSYIMGGRYYSYFSTIDGDNGFNPAPGLDAWDTILGATVKQGNTWASIKFIADSWSQKIYHSFGIDNIGGSKWSIGFDSHDTGTANLGQQFMGDLFNDFKADPYFNTCDLAGSINLKYITDTFEFRGEAKVYDSDGSTPANGEHDEIYDSYAAGLIFKSDIGKYYIGAKYKDAKPVDGDTDGIAYEDPLYILGADLKLNDVGLKIDFWSDKSGVSNQGEFAELFWGVVTTDPKTGKPTSYGGHQTLQATIEFDKLTGQFVYSQPELDLDDIIGLGAAYKVSDKLTLGAKYFMVDEDQADNGTYDVYGLYKVGVWDIKVGTCNARFPYGHAGDKTEGGNYNDKQAKYYEDSFFYLGVHFEF